MKEPPVEEFDLGAWHRLIKSRYSQSGTVLLPLVETTEELANLALLDGIKRFGLSKCAVQRGTIHCLLSTCTRLKPAQS